ncbi:MAG: hypothetical protein ACD_47C00124G0001 [uncultured bacterium]|nr:MAG: hypothetical protein ACD_47C00124G0001 [uncultured bacterium]
MDDGIVGLALYYLHAFAYELVAVALRLVYFGEASVGFYKVRLDGLRALEEFDRLVDEVLVKVYLGELEGGLIIIRV